VELHGKATVVLDLQLIKSSFLNEIIQRPYSVDISQFLRRGWQIFAQYAGGFIGFWLITFVIGAVLSRFSIFGLIANVIISGILSAGYFFVAFKIAKGSQIGFEDFFKGFKNTYFLPLFLANLVLQFFVGTLYFASIVSFTPAIYNKVRELVNSVLSSPSANAMQLPELLIPPELTHIFLILGLLMLLSAIYFGVAYTFTIPLIVDKKIGFWDALETSRQLITKKWFSVFGFSLVLSLINLAGLLFFFAGFILTVPFTVNAVAASYESIVGLSSSNNGDI
jgi:hypothetical protein